MAIFSKNAPLEKAAIRRVPFTAEKAVLSYLLLDQKLSKIKALAKKVTESETTFYKRVLPTLP